MNNKTSKITDLSPSISSPPDLSTELILLYEALTNDNKRLFVRIYRYLWGVVCPMSRFIRYSGVIYSYWLVDHLRRKYDLSVTALSLLSLIYHLTNNGRKTIHSKFIYNNGMRSDIRRESIMQELQRLKQRGYLTRLRRDPDNKYTPGTQYSHPVFVRISTDGVHLIEQIERDLHNILFRTSLDDLRGKQIKKQ